MNNRLLDEIREIMALILEVDSGQINEQTSQENTDAWDSLAHLNLVLALEEKYGIELLPEEMEQLVTMSDVTGMVQRKLDKQ